jgi:plasmid stabilization system protein ParE
MAYEIVWTPQARKTFFSIIEYLSTNFTGTEINKFVQKTDDKIELIKYPNTYRKSTRVKNVYFTNILGKSLLIYQVMPRKKQIILIKFWDGRQNPNTFRV